MITRKDIISIERNLHGYLIVTALHNNNLLTYKVSGFTKRDSIKLALVYFNENDYKK